MNDQNKTIARILLKLIFSKIEVAKYGFCNQAPKGKPPEHLK